MKYAKISLIAGLFVVLVFYDNLLVLKFSGSGTVENFLDLVNPLSELEEKIYKLERENAELKAQISTAVLEAVPAGNESKIYSTYPFNGKGEAVITGGHNKGFKIGDSVTFGDSVLVGKIKEVLETSSIITTIFDPKWESAVRIGEEEIDGLLKGGNVPVVTLIQRDAKIEVGDIVISTGPDFPYGFKVGTIKNIKEISGEPFKEAVVEINVRLSELRDVSVYH